MGLCINPSKYGRCRKCPGCIETRANSWVLRMHLESMLYPKQQVTTCTLTYRNSQLPSSDAEAKQQFQKFMKRLRKDLGFEVRYFAALEKGSQTSRYHWHVIMFGMSCNWVNSEYLKKKWGHGFVRRFEPIRSSGGLSYAAKYALKDRCYLASRIPPLGDGMISSINKTIEALSPLERDKIISGQKLFQIFDVQTGGANQNQLFTITSLRLNGFYYPLHDYIKKRLRRFTTSQVPIYRRVYGSSQEET